MSPLKRHLRDADTSSMKLRLVEHRDTVRVCAHGIRLAPLDVYLAQEGMVARSMYCADCRREEQDELDAELAGFVPEP
jgi:hypothetical protein